MSAIFTLLRKGTYELFLTQYLLTSYSLQTLVTIILFSTSMRATFKVYCLHLIYHFFHLILSIFSCSIWLLVTVNKLLIIYSLFLDHSDVQNLAIDLKLHSLQNSFLNVKNILCIHSLVIVFPLCSTGYNALSQETQEDSFYEIISDSNDFLKPLFPCKCEFMLPS